MALFENNTGGRIGGIAGIVLAFIFNGYLYDSFSPPVSLALMCFFMAAGGPLGAYLYKKLRKGSI